MKRIIHFAHANGFPACSYRKLFSFLQDDFQINYINRHGHDPRFPVTDDWSYLKLELEEQLKNRYRRPVIGLGHSLGGLLHLLVAAGQPGLYSSIILLDAPIISPLSSLLIKYAKKTNLMERYSPARSTRTRRAHWKDLDEAFEHFRRKKKFARFDEQMLRDYLKCGTMSTARGLELSFRPEIEAQIYATLPHNLPKLRGKLPMPLAYIGGTRSQEARLARLGFMKKHFAVRFCFLEGSHLFPFEDPEKTARLIRSLIRRSLPG